MQQVKSNSYSREFKQKVCEAYVNSNRTKVSIWREYVGQEKEHGCMIEWLREFGYIEAKDDRRGNSIFRNMPKEEANTEEGSFETKQLKKRISELEQQLKDAEMKAIAFSTMVDIAEEEFKIPIRKKLNTKPSKK